jgi:hypothetical protein
MGHWISESGERTSEELWLDPRGGMMLGMNRDAPAAAVAPDRTSFEFLRIVERSDGIYYLASPGGRSPPTEFRLTTLGEQRAVFANAKHDFPKFLVYKREGNQLLARAEGVEGGKPAALEYRWTLRGSVPAQALSAADAQVQNFCADAQKIVGNTQRVAGNIFYQDYEAFVKSKPRVNPLETDQYHWYEDDARTRLKMISCKMKTSDHIRTEYGANSAGEQGSCALANRATLYNVLATITDAERPRLKFDGGRAVVLDPDELTNMGPVWLEPYAMAYIGADAALHIKSKGMRNDWLDPRYASAPPQFKGTSYCHLVAPAYLRRLLLGEAP